MRAAPLLHLHRFVAALATWFYLWSAAFGFSSPRTDFNGTISSYTHDALNRLLTRTSNHASAAASIVTFTYTASGQRGTMTDASGVTTYSYDALGRLGNVTDRELGATHYAYDAVGNLSSFATPNGVTHAYGYDSVNRLTQMLVSAVPATGPPGTLASYTYALSPTGRRNGVQESGAGILPANPASSRTVSYLYDALDRLTRETITAPSGPAGQTSFTYDAVGDRLSRTSTVPGLPAQSFGYDANDRLTSDTYDANGNTTTGRVPQPTVSQVAVPVPPETTVIDRNDYEDRLKTRSGAVNVRMLYNGDGQRVAETIGGQTVSYLVDDLNPTGYAQVVEERTNRTVTRTYTYGHDLLAQDTRDGGGNWTASYFGYDGHGSVRFLTNELGALTDTYTYDAYGTLLTSTGTTANKFRYAGEEFDPSLGLYNLRARYLNAANGRFWNADTYEGQSTDPQSLHRYNYAYGNPANLSDPSGNNPTLAVTMMNVAARFGGVLKLFVPSWASGGVKGWGLSTLATVGFTSYLSSVTEKYVGETVGALIPFSQTLSKFPIVGNRMALEILSYASLLADWQYKFVTDKLLWAVISPVFAAPWVSGVILANGVSQFAGAVYGIEETIIHMAQRLGLDVDVQIDEWATVGRAAIFSDEVSPKHLIEALNKIAEAYQRGNREEVDAGQRLFLEKLKKIGTVRIYGAQYRFTHNGWDVRALFSKQINK